ncbi:two-component system sensor histidine kinase EvgS [Burkholderia ambifaria]|nr:transporter substrate-binding domain-containing protein [Burkholderia ambifaria]MDR6503947.1 two-component system sensor histidine kinase EvgS [Burkholderia ambifaria]
MLPTAVAPGNAHSTIILETARLWPCRILLGRPPPLYDRPKRSSDAMSYRLWWCAALLFVVLAMSSGGRAVSAAEHAVPAIVDIKVPVTLSVEQKAWLAARVGRIKAGIVSRGLEPFDIVDSQGRHDGISASYLEIIERAAGVGIDIVKFGSETELRDAVRERKVDIGASMQRRGADPGLVYSTPYFANQIVVASRQQDALYVRGPGRENERVLAYVPDLMPAEEVQRQYPEMTVEPFPTMESALNAVAFGQADSLVGNATAINYLIEQLQLLNVRITDFARFDADDFRFAANARDRVVIDMIDQILAAIPASRKMAIQIRWGAMSNYYGTSNPHLTDEERKWVAAHPVVRYAVPRDFPPFVFRASDGGAAGLAVDLLKDIGERTGLTFEPVFDPAGLKRADLRLAVPRSDSGVGGWQLSAPYAMSPWVIVTRAGGERANGLASLDGQSIALEAGNPAAAVLVKLAPNTRIVGVADAWAAMSEVAEGRTSATIQNIETASYVIRQKYRDRLVISLTNADTNYPIGFAVRSAVAPLLALLDKGIVRNSPLLINALRQQWQSTGLPESLWSARLRYLRSTLLVMALLGVISIGWIYMLRRQVRARRLAESNLEDQLAFQVNLFASLPLPFCLLDSEARFVECNEALARAYDRPRDALIGRRISELHECAADDLAWIEAHHSQVMRTGQPVFADRSWRPLGRNMDATFWFAPLHDRAGAIVGTMGGWIDMTQRAELERAMQQAKDRAEEASLAKSTFLATVSHEIRTPMNAVLGVLELLKQSPASVRSQSDSIEAAYESANGLLTLIDDILDLSKIEAGKVELAAEPCDVEAILSSMARVFDGLARQKHVEFTVHIDNPERLGAVVDPHRFRQVIGNLLSNAVKFTEKGRVALHASITCTGESQVHVDLTVSDTGIGMTDTQQACLFEPFVQADQSIGIRFGGTGLGLSICRSLVDMMGGTIEVTSAAGIGTAVRVALDAPAVARGGATQHIETPPQNVFLGHMALIVDDHPANRLVLRRQLEYLGFRVEAAADGAGALDAWWRGSFDIVVTDCLMPEMSGYELTQRLRDEEARSGVPRTPIVGYTANIQRDMLTRARSAGMDMCLMKPLSLTALAARLAALGLQTGKGADCQDGAEGRADVTGLIDMAALAGISAGDAATESELLGAILEANRADLDRLRGAIEEGDRAAFASIVHRIRGATRLIGARAAVHACNVAEAGAQDGGDIPLAELGQPVFEHIDVLDREIVAYRTQDIRSV